jgi:hypothetical protein
MKRALPGTFDTKDLETIEDAVLVTAEVNRRDGRPHCLAYARQCEAAVVACRTHLEDYATAIRYMRDHGLRWPPPETGCQASRLPKKPKDHEHRGAALGQEPREASLRPNLSTLKKRRLNCLTNRNQQ